VRRFTKLSIWTRFVFPTSPSLLYRMEEWSYCNSL